MGDIITKEIRLARPISLADLPMSLENHQQ